MVFGQNLKNVHFKAFIHTIQIGSRFPVYQDEDIFCKPYITKRPIHLKERVHYIINPNKFYDCGIIYSFDECETIIAAIIEELGLTDKEWRIERIDITFDTTTGYDQLFKLNCYFKELYAIQINEDNAYRVIGDDLKKRSTVVKNRKYELEIYNKNIQSGNYLLPSTRCEFRRKQLYKRRQINWRQTIRDEINKVHSNLRLIPELIPNLDRIKGKILVDSYTHENASDCEGRIRNLHEFTVKFADYIYTRSSLRILFNKIKGGNFKSWLYRYNKSGRVLTLINKGIIVFYCKKLRDALRDYQK